MRFLLLLTLYLQSSLLFGQKSEIDSSVLGKWPYLANPAVSSDGKYLAYSVEKLPLESQTLVVKSVDDDWSFSFVGAINGLFSGDGKTFFFQTNDSLFSLSLEHRSYRCLGGILSCKWPSNENTKWIAYQQLHPGAELVLLDATSNKEMRIPSVKEYAFDQGGKVLFFVTEVKLAQGFAATVEWLSLRDGKRNKIWTSLTSLSDSSSINSYDLDENGSQLVFLVNHMKEGRHTTTQIMYYKDSMDTAIAILNKDFSELNITVKGPVTFSKNGRWIFFQLQDAKPDSIQFDQNMSKVDVWSYKDLDIQPNQQYRLSNGPRSFWAVMSPTTKWVRLEHENERTVMAPSDCTGDYIVVKDQDDVGHWWKFAPQPSYYLMSLQDGKRFVLKKHSNSLDNFSFSPSGRYLVFFDWAKSAYFSHHIGTGLIQNISQSVPTSLKNEYPTGTFSSSVAPIAGWHYNDSFLLVYDNYDVWKLDAVGRVPAVNVTNGYGKRYNIKFRIINSQPGIHSNSYFTFQHDDKLLLTAFNQKNKWNGFFSKSMNAQRDPDSLTMGPFTFFKTGTQLPHFYSFDDGMKPLKAQAVDLWIVKRQSYQEAPNYFLTRDFKQFRPVTQLNPNKGYNWLKAELVTWKQLDGSYCQGVLYKPENFDSTKKYPLIFNIYEKLSHRLYEFPYPQYTEANINIPWFVSRGYLVFTPDIHYSIASKSQKTTGEHAYNSVVSAINHLSKLHFINSKKIGIQAHSFGAFETNYLIANTHLFAAAAEFAGTTDIISSYLTLIPFLSSIEHMSKQSTSEIGGGRYGATLWERPDLYLKGTIVLNANRINTPLLITHNFNDNQVQFRQGVEFYMALRRLSKKAWMLQYDEGSHGVFDRDAVDYTIRLTQFFDHYLQDKLPPVWMTRGIPASQKGFRDGYDLDKDGQCGIECPVCNGHRR